MQQWTVGDVTVQCALEIAIDTPAVGLLPEYTWEAVLDHRDVLQPHYLTEAHQVRVAIQSFLIRSADRRIIVDTCFGTGHQLPYPGLEQLQSDHLDALAAAGFGRTEVDIVLCTHLHIDHVGWNTMLVDGKWVPTFPNATYLFGQSEYEHWLTGGDGNASLVESVTPIVEAGQHRLVSMHHDITSEIRLQPTPGHTPGHVSVRIESAGEAAFITGDMLHHPVQVFRPDWRSAADINVAMAHATRQRMFAELADNDVLVLGTHFAEPAGGHVRRAGDGWLWEALET